MAYRSTLNRLAKKDLIALYNISYPTLRRWLRRAGLHCFIGRKKLEAAEVVLIFQHLGKPQLARTAAQRLKDAYYQVLGKISEEQRYQEKFGEEAPKLRQDQLADSLEEQDHPQVYPLERQTVRDPKHIWDALCRLRCAAIKITGNLAAKKQASQTATQKIHKIHKKKRLNKGYRSAA